MKILIAGSSGLLGTAICAALSSHGYHLFKLKRTQTAKEPFTIFWNPEKGELDAPEIEGFDVIINLAGENIFGRWTAHKKQKILDSRIQTTSLLAKTISKLHSPPELFLNASAIGYYGNRGNEVLTESSSAGEDFLADVCRQWERAAEAAKSTQTRCAVMRTGVVLSPHGGALKTMLLPFKLGLGGRVGEGKQYMSWITIDDVVEAMLFIIQHKDCTGAFNFTAPNPVTNQAFTHALSQKLNRPAILPLPAVAARLIFGEMADALLLASIRAHPQKLLEKGYSFLYPDIQGALSHLLSKN